MTTEEKIEKRIEEVFSNDQVLESVFNAETPDQLCQTLQDNGVIFEEVSKEEVFEAFQRAKNPDQLSENDLENVNGGVYFALKAGAFYLAVSGSVAGALCVVGGVAVIGLATYAAYRYIKKKV